MARFQGAQPTGVAVAQLEILVRTAVFKTANELVGWMLQQAVDRIFQANGRSFNVFREFRKFLDPAIKPVDRLGEFAIQIYHIFMHQFYAGLDVADNFVECVLEALVD